MGTDSVVQRQQTRTAGQTIQNLVPFRAVSPVYSPTPVSPLHSSAMRPNAQPLVASLTLHLPTQSVRSMQWCIDLQQAPTRAQQQPTNLQQQPLDLVSPTMGEDAWLDSL